MADWPILSNIITISESYEVNLTPGSDNTKTSYSELISALSYDVSGFIVFPSAGNYGDWLFDLAVGSAGSEVDILSNLLFSAKLYREVNQVYFPVSIPSGTRISTRAQCRAALARNYNIGFHPIYRYGFLKSSCSRILTLGANTADSGGTSVDPGGTVDTKGSWVEFSSSLPFTSRYILVSLGCQQIARDNATWYYDIGIGAAGSEVAIISDIQARCHADQDEIWPHFFGLIPVEIPIGNRVAMRCKASITSASRYLDFILYIVG